MLSLFNDIPILPEGFTYQPNFLTPEEEAQWLAEIEKEDLQNMLFHGYIAKRKTLHYGWGWSFEDRTLEKGNEIPETFAPLIKKAASRLFVDPLSIAGMLITEYPPGAVINWHRDAPPYEKIIGISLLSDAVFRFRPYDKLKQSRGSIISLPVQRRSIYMIENQARREWEHSIEPVNKKRYSVTMRTVR